MNPLQVVAEPRRQAILLKVWDQESSVGEIAQLFDVTLGAVSQHLRVLTEAGFLNQRREGNFRYYSANKANLGPLREYLEQLWSGHLHALKTAAEADERQKHRHRTKHRRRH
jgi:DNA-binding transcriptional ArsR family regulator